MKKLKYFILATFIFLIGFYITCNINVSAEIENIGNSNEIIGYNQKTQYGYYTRTITIKYNGIVDGYTYQSYKDSFTISGEEYNSSNNSGNFDILCDDYKEYEASSKSSYHSGDTRNYSDTDQASGVSKDTIEDFQNQMNDAINSGINGAVKGRNATRFLFLKTELGDNFDKWKQYYIGNGWYYNCKSMDDSPNLMWGFYDYKWEGIYLTGNTYTRYSHYKYSYTISDSEIVWYNEKQSDAENSFTFTKTMGSGSYSFKKYYDKRIVDDSPIIDKTDDYKIITSEESFTGNYKILKYRNDGSNTVLNTTTISSNQTTSINQVGKYKVINYADSNYKTPASAIAYYYIENKNIYLSNEDGKPITETNPTKNTKVYLHFNTQLNKEYLKEFIQQISIGNQTYTGNSKNNWIDGEGFDVPVNTQLTFTIDDGSVFNPYNFIIDNTNPSLNWEGIEGNDVLINGTTLITSNEGIKFSWNEPNCTFYKDELNTGASSTYNIYNDCEVELQDKAGNSTTYIVKIIDASYLKIISNQKRYNYDYNDGYYNTDITLELKPFISNQDYAEKEPNSNQCLNIEYKYSIYKNSELINSIEDFTIEQKNITLKDEGTYTITIEYSIGGTFTTTIVIDKTAPYKAINYLEQNGYNSSKIWYNTYDKDGANPTIYSFSFKTIESTNNINYYSASSYAVERELNYTIKLPYDANEEYLREYSIADIGTIIPSGFGDSYNQNNSDGYVYIYKSSNWKSTGKYVVYFTYDEYNKQLQKIANDSIEEINPVNQGIYNPCPTINGKIYYTYLTYEGYPIFYLQTLNLNTLQNKSIEEIGSTTSFNLDTLKNGLNEIIETDKAGNSTTYFIYLCAVNPVAEILNGETTVSYNTDNIYYLTKTLTINPAINDKQNSNIDQYSIIQYKVNNGSWNYYNCYNFIENEYQNLQFLENGKYDIRIYSITGLTSSLYTIYVYKNGISYDIRIIEDEEGEQVGLSIEFEAENPVISEGQFSQITIKREGEEISLDYENNPIKIINNKNSYSFYFETNGNYEITVVDKFSNHLSDGINPYSYNIALSLGSPTGKLYKIIKTTTGIEEEEISGQTYLIHNYIVKFTWNLSKNYYATLNGVSYQSGSNITQEGTHTLILKNGDNEELNKVYTIVIDKTAPVGYFIDLQTTDENGYILNNQGNATSNKITDFKYISGNRNGISFASDEKSYTTKIKKSSDYEVFDKNYKFIGEENKELEYIIILQDLAGNTTEYTLILDYQIANVYLIIGLSNSTISMNTYWVNKPFYLQWNEKNVKIIINSEEYQNGKKIIYEDTTSIKEYSIYITDGYNNKQYLTIYYDNTTPKLNLSKISLDGTKTEIQNGSKINGGFEISWLESKEYNVKITYYNDETQREETLDNIKNGTIINTELNPNSTLLYKKKYTIKVSNLAGTEKEYYIYLCNTFYDVNVYIGTTIQNSSINNFITNKAVKFSWATNDTSAILNGVPYTSLSKIEEDGLYELTITDVYGNQYKYNFEIDTIAPELELQTTTAFVENGTNGDITIISKESNNYTLEYVKENETYSIPTNYMITNEGSYIIKLIDQAGNITEKNVVIDKTAPSYEVIGFTLNPTITKNNVKFSWNEYDSTGLLNNQTYKQNSIISEDGNYTFILMDKYGNKNVFNFTIDTKLIEYDILGVNEKNYSNSYVIFIFDVDKYKATLNGEEYTMGTELQEENEYTIIFSSIEIPDKTITYNFIIDKTAPELELETISSTGFVIEDEIYYTNNSFTIKHSSNDVCMIDDGTTIKEDITNKYYSTEGMYTITLTDKAGNSTEYKVCIDKKEISFYILSSSDEMQSYILNEYTQTTKSNFYNSDIKLILPDGSKATLNDNEYSSNELITSEGNYTMVLINKLGTKSTLLFTIDKTAPTIELSGIYENNKSSSTVRLNIEDKNTYKIYNVKQETNDEGIAEEVLQELNLQSFSENGNYNIKVIDVAGNESLISFTILKRELYSNIKIVQDDNKETITCNVSDIENYKIYVDNEIVQNLSSYNTPGQHQLKIEDEYGNQYLSSFTINAPKVVSHVFNNVMTIILVVSVAGLIIILIIKKTKSSKKNPYTKG